jgi:benzoyl-CoA reductase/2-hydroxyglutaryl-CoA dehydratase subunit BcrC/BadD/HgdB
VAAVLPIHYPRALLRAFDILPVEVWGPPGVDVTHGAAHLQPYVCSIVRNALSFLRSGGLEVVDLIVVPHACDSLQGFGSLLIDFVRPEQPVLPLYIPRGKRALDKEFLAAELRALYQRLESHTGRSPDAQQLADCIQREEAADRLLPHLRERSTDLGLDAETYYRLVRSREYLPAEDFVALAEGLLARPAQNHTQSTPILLSGILPEPMGLLSAIAAAGGAVVADDLASCGRRMYPAGESDEPFLRMAERIALAPPDPTRGSPIGERLEYLCDLVTRFGAQGVVFYAIKFCEPELFDYPDLREGLREAGIPSLVIEGDIDDRLSHQLVSRLQAFLEMVA